MNYLLLITGWIIVSFIAGWIFSLVAKTFNPSDVEAGEEE